MDYSSQDLTTFQHQLLSALSDNSVSSDSFVALRLDKDGWLIDLDYLKEASVPSKIARHAHAPRWMVGIANFKGEVWSIVDMKMLAKNTPTLNPTWGWVTLLRSDVQLDKDKHVKNASKNSPSSVIDQHLGLLWTEIVEIAPKGEYDIHPAPPERFCRAQYKDKNGVVWKELDVAQIVGEKGLGPSFSIPSHENKQE